MEGVPHKREKGAESKKEKITSATGKAALLAAFFSMNASPSAHAESASGSADSDDAPASVEPVSAEEERWDTLEKSINSSPVYSAYEAPGTGVLSADTYGQAQELMSTVRGEAGFDSLLTQGRESLSHGLGMVLEQIPGAGEKTRMLGDGVVMAVVGMIDIELSSKLSGAIENHISQDGTLESASEFVRDDFATKDRRDTMPDIPFGHTWGSETEGGKGWSLKAGVDPFSAYGLSFDPAVGVKFEKRF